MFIDGETKAYEGIEQLFDKSDVLSTAFYRDLPSPASVEKILSDVKLLVYPEFFSDERDEAELRGIIGCVEKGLENAIFLAFSYSRERAGEKRDCKNAYQTSREITSRFLKALPKIKSLLKKDVEATLNGDPAATSPDVILLTYPGIEATFTHRVARVLYEEGVPLIPRIMSELAHSKTGIDIHPGAKIGESFVIDHGTGIVVGETAEIGDRVNLYQGVTLGAISLKNARSLVGVKRHPTLENDVTVYAGATILGGETVIGEGSIIGSSVFLTESVPPRTTVTLKKPELKVSKRSL